MLANHKSPSPHPELGQVLVALSLALTEKGVTASEAQLVRARWEGFKSVMEDWMGCYEAKVFAPMGVRVRVFAQV